MEKLNRDTKRYLREIRSWIPCAGKMRREVLEEIRGTLAEFLSENPDADFPALVARFGTPQQIASTYVDEAETGELLNALRIRKKMVRIACVTAVILISIWATAVTIELFCDAYKIANSTFEVKITEHERIPLEGE